MPMIVNRPDSSRKAAMNMMEKYGLPAEMTGSMLMWKKHGRWKWTRISNEEVPHRFPKPHPEVLEQGTGSPLWGDP